MVKNDFGIAPSCLASSSDAMGKALDCESDPDSSLASAAFQPRDAAE